MPVFAHFRQRVGSVAKRLGGSRGYAGSQNLLEDKGNATVLPILGHASPRSPPPPRAGGGRERGAAWLLPRQIPELYRLCCAQLEQGL